MTETRKKQLEIVTRRLRAENLDVMAVTVERLIADYEILLAENEILKRKIDCD